MSGFSDVRLVLKSQEMQAEHCGTRVKNTTRPEGFSRWQWFWHCRRTRQQLGCLTAEQLYDIGMTAERAHVEAMKSFWQH